MSQAKRKATHARYYADAPQIVEPDGTKHWITRAANFALVYTDAAKGARLERSANADEYMVLLPVGTRAEIAAGTETVSANDDSLTIVPPGASTVRLPEGGRVVRIFSAQATDVLAQAANAGTYADGAAEVVPITPWPAPARGYRLYHYNLRDCPSPDSGALKMRVFRSTNLMINVFLPWLERRDESRLTPHFHDAFEQMSLSMEGAFVHHLRYPWGPDKASWIEDEHEHYESPAVLVIPTYVMHTTQDVGGGTTRLVDVFAPPRLDFSERPGFVVNAADYPMPAQA